MNSQVAQLPAPNVQYYQPTYYQQQFQQAPQQYQQSQQQYQPQQAYTPQQLLLYQNQQRQLQQAQYQQALQQQQQQAKQQQELLKAQQEMQLEAQQRVAAYAQQRQAAIADSRALVTVPPTSAVNSTTAMRSQAPAVSQAYQQVQTAPARPSNPQYYNQSSANSSITQPYQQVTQGTTAFYPPSVQGQQQTFASVQAGGPSYQQSQQQSSYQYQNSSALVPYQDVQQQQQSTSVNNSFAGNFSAPQYSQNESAAMSLFECGNILDFDEDQVLAWARLAEQRETFLKDKEIAEKLQQQEGPGLIAKPSQSALKSKPASRPSNTSSSAPQLPFMDVCSSCNAHVGKANMNNHRAVECLFRPQRCNYCGKGVKVIEHADHVEICGSRKHFCNVCGLQLLGRDVPAHMMQMHKNSM